MDKTAIIRRFENLWRVSKADRDDFEAKIPYKYLFEGSYFEYPLDTFPIYIPLLR